MSNGDVCDPYSPYQWYTTGWKSKLGMHSNSVYHPFFN